MPHRRYHRRGIDCQPHTDTRARARARYALRRRIQHNTRIHTRAARPRTTPTRHRRRRAVTRAAWSRPHTQHERTGTKKVFGRLNEKKNFDGHTRASSSAYLVIYGGGVMNCTARGDGFCFCRFRSLPRCGVSRVADNDYGAKADPCNAKHRWLS